ncbi:hypothetical protein AAIH32_12800 [Pseudarthrobacter oxydans]|uniref:hypothetical protein n=1 Tax=Pseudarthrobacter oxydans TaxID=1671 RepID=UPI003D2E76A4
MTAGFYNDDFHRKFWKDQEAFKSLQKTINDTIAPAMEAIRQSVAITDAQKHILATIRPAIDISTFNAAKAIAESINFDFPALPSVSFTDVRRLKLGDDVAQKFVGSVDVADLNKFTAPPAEYETPAMLPAPLGDEPALVPEVDPTQLTEEDLDHYVDTLLLLRPGLPQELDEDPELQHLNGHQKKIYIWLLSLMVVCGMSVLHTWGTFDENVAHATEVSDQVVDGGISGSGDIKKVTFRKVEDFAPVQSPADEPEDE